MQRVLITGATGMIGANLTRKLVADGFRVCVLARPNTNRLRLRDIADSLQFIIGDLSDELSVCRAVDKAAPDIVYHLASTPFNPPTSTPQEHYQTNVLGTLALVEALRISPQTRLIYTGTAAVYDTNSKSRENDALRPSTILGASKAAATILIQACAKLYGMRAIELRLFMPYGPWEHPRRLVPQAILAALNGQDLPMTCGSQERDLVYVGDVVEALILAAKSTAPSGSVFNIGSGIGTPIKNVVNMVFRLAGATSRVRLGALPTRPDEIMHMSADIHKASQEPGWKPRTTLEQGLRQTIIWHQEHRAIVNEMHDAPRQLAA